MNPDDRIQSAFSDLANQSGGADPEPGLAKLADPGGAGSGSTSGSRPWLRAVAAAAVIVGTVGVIAVVQRGDDPVGPAAQPTSTTAPSPSSTMAESAAVTDITEVTATTVALVPSEQVDGYLLADQAGVSLYLADGTTRQLTTEPAVVAFSDRDGGIVWQTPTDAVMHLDRSGRTETVAHGDLQQVVSVDDSVQAVILQRIEDEGGESFTSTVFRVDLASGARTDLWSGPASAYRIFGDLTVVSGAAEESTIIQVLDGSATVFEVSEPSGGILRHGVVGPGPDGEPLVAYFRNDFASNSAVLVVQEPDGSNLKSYPIPSGVGMRLDLLGDHVALSFGDGLAVSGFALLDLVTGAEQAPPFPGTATLMRGPLPAFAAPQRSTPSASWRVVGVDEGTFLNVRSGPGTDNEVMGRLFPGDVDVEVTGFGFVDLDGTGWFEVILEDGTVGYTSSEFLAPPASWQVGFDELACGGAGPQLADPSGESAGTVVSGWAHVSDGDCDRYVIALGTGDAFDGVLAPADIVTPGTTGGVDGLGVRVLLPGVTDVEPIAQNAMLGGRLALVAQSLEGQTDFHAQILGIGDGDVWVTTLSHPARIVIDVRNAVTNGGPVLGQGTTILAAPIAADAASSPIVVNGYARWFEAQGTAELRSPDGSPGAGEIGGPSVQGVGGPSVGISAPYVPTWGEFVLTVAAGPGDYELFVGEQCFADNGSDTSVECGVTQRFTVVD